MTKYIVFRKFFNTETNRSDWEPLNICKTYKSARSYCKRKSLYYDRFMISAIITDEYVYDFKITNSTDITFID